MTLGGPTAKADVYAASVRTAMSRPGPLRPHR